MPQRRNILFHGLGITLTRLPALLWAYAFNLALALIFSASLHLQLRSILDHSLASQRLANGFDIGILAETILRLHDGPAAASGNIASHASIPIFFLIYFLLVPGTLLCYQTRASARLSTLLRQGMLHFWRFVRITLLTLLVSLLILGPLIALHNLWTDWVHDHIVGLRSLLLILPGVVIIILAATFIRLYFDLVEVYTVQLGQQHRSSRSGKPKPDFRVRKTLGPALRTLRLNLARAWITFLVLGLLGAAAVIATARTATLMLAQPRAWPIFLLAQLGLFLLLFTRFWQRGTETSLALQFPLPLSHPTDHLYTTAYRNRNPPPPPPTPVPASIEPAPAPAGRHVDMIYTMDPLNPIYPAPLSTDDSIVHPPEDNPAYHPAPSADPIPNPEPAPPSLDEPDPGVFHHDPVKPPERP